MRNLRSWRLPTTFLARVRVLFLGYALFNAFVLIPQITLDERSSSLDAAALVGVGVMAWHWIRSNRRGSHSWIGDVLVAIVIGMEVDALGKATAALGLLYISLQAQSFYDNWRRIMVRYVLYCVSFAVGVATSPDGTAGLLLLAYQLPNLAINSSVMHLLAIALKRQEKTNRRQLALAKTSAAMASAVTHEQICEASLHGVLGAAPVNEPLRATVAIVTAGEMRVLATVGDDALAAGDRSLGLEAMPAHLRAELLAGQQVRMKREQLQSEENASYPLRRAALLTPLMSQSELRGLLIVAGDNVLGLDIDDTVRAIATQLSLALEGEALREDLLARRSEARSRSLVQNSSDLILIVDASGAIRFQTPSVTSVLGLGEGSLEGRNVHSLIHPDDAPHFAAMLEEVKRVPGATATARARWMHGQGDGLLVGDTAISNLLDDPHVRGIVLNTRDVTGEMRLQEELRRQAFHDSLTELANRALFEDRVEHAIDRADRHEARIAVLFLDIDDFKKVNDSLGHPAGDELLVAVAARLTRAVRESDTVARLGGDEFAVLLEDITGSEGTITAAERIREELAKPLVLHGRTVGLQASIGIAVRAPRAGRTPDLMRDADLAMYAAKAAGKNRYELFNAGIRAPVLDRLQLESDLRAGLDNGELFVEYQPIVRLADGSIDGVEALVRWRHPERGVVPPMQFIPVSEETGLIVAIGDFVLRQALKDCRRWSEGLATPVGVSVNFSARQFQEPTLVADVGRALREAGVEASLLTVEITESVLMRDADASAERLSELRDLGVRIAIDDFGTGYSSLSYLNRFPADSIKVDRSFVDLIRGGVDDPVLPRAIVALGNSMGLVTVAEGIERREQLDALRAIGCELGQGFYFAKPRPFEMIRDMIAAAPRRTAAPPGVADLAWIGVRELAAPPTAAPHAA